MDDRDWMEAAMKATRDTYFIWAASADRKNIRAAMRMMRRYWRKVRSAEIGPIPSMMDPSNWFIAEGAPAAFINFREEPASHTREWKYRMLQWKVRAR
jgi:hypothetical protein